MDDSALYTGIDCEPGLFENEGKDEEVKKTISDQERQIRELTPKLQDVFKLIDAEIASVMSIKRFTTAAAQSKKTLVAELQAAALYEGYLQALKTKFVLALREAKKAKDE